MNYHLPPPIVVETVQRYQKPNEEKQIYLYPANYENVIYFYAIFLEGKEIVGDIIVREDGVVPPKEQIRDILWMIVTTSSIAHFFQNEGLHWARAPKWVMEKQLAFLERVERAFRAKMPPDVQEALEVFKSVPRIHLSANLDL